MLRADKKLTLDLFSYWFSKRHNYMNYDQRADLVRKYIHEFPGNAEFYRMLCHCCKRCFSFDGLAFVLSFVPHTNKLDSCFLRYYGRLAIRAGLYSTSIKIFEELILRNDCIVNDYLLLAENHKGNNDNRSFENVLKKGKAKFPSEAEIPYRLALHYYDQKNFCGVGSCLKQSEKCSNINVDVQKGISLLIIKLEIL